MNCLFLIPDSQPTVTELFQLLLYRSAAYQICSVTFFFCSHLKTHFFELCYRNYCCRAREVTLSFMDTLIALTYLLYLTHSHSEQSIRHHTHVSRYFSFGWLVSVTVRKHFLNLQPRNRHHLYTQYIKKVTIFTTDSGKWFTPRLSSISLELCYL